MLRRSRFSFDELTYSYPTEESADSTSALDRPVTLTCAGAVKPLTLAPDEFIRRFLLHVLPDGFHRIRYYGLFASGTRAANIARIRSLLARPAPPREAASEPEPAAVADPPAGPACPCCGGRMIIVERFQRGEVPRLRPSAVGIDTS